MWQISLSVCVGVNVFRERERERERFLPLIQVYHSNYFYPSSFLSVMPFWLRGEPVATMPHKSWTPLIVKAWPIIELSSIRSPTPCTQYWHRPCNVNYETESFMEGIFWGRIRQICRWMEKLLNGWLPHTKRFFQLKGQIHCLRKD